MTHPHNANPADYAAALDATAALVIASNRAEAAGYALVFGTIEATDARRDAIAARKAVLDACEVVHAAHAAVLEAQRKAEARAATLARIEGRIA
jgi:hypothetical protein